MNNGLLLQFVLKEQNSGHPQHILEIPSRQYFVNLQITLAIVKTYLIGPIKMSQVVGFTYREC